MSKKRSQSQMILETIEGIADGTPTSPSPSPEGDASPIDQEMAKVVGFLKNPDNNGKTVEVQTRLLSIASNIRRDVPADEAFEALKHSIATYGLLQPVIVQLHNGKPTITAGHRRFKACTELGVEKIRIIARNEDRTTLQVFENIHRADLSPIEYCEAIKALKDSNQGWTIADLCKAIGQADRKTVGYYLKIADWSEERKKKAIAQNWSKRQLIAMEKSKSEEAMGDASPKNADKLETILSRMTIAPKDRKTLLRVSRPLLTLSKIQLEQLEALVKELKQDQAGPAEPADGAPLPH